MTTKYDGVSLEIKFKSQYIVGSIEIYDEIRNVMNTSLESIFKIVVLLNLKWN